MRLRLVLILCFLVLSVGCREASSEAISAGAGESFDDVLSELTQALRKYSAEKRQVPDSLDDLVAAGYLKKQPEPPTGKEFRIAPKTLGVIVR